LLKRGLEKDPKHKNRAPAYWGQALFSLTNTDQGHRSLARADEINPFDDFAYDLWVNSVLGAIRNPTRRRRFSPQLELTPRS